jgi:membrane protein YqaA with SNARE-associated domain
LAIEYLLLFSFAFISATLFPLGSEALLIYNLEIGLNPTLLLTFASIGNILGSSFNYYIGLKGEEYLEQRGILKSTQIESTKSFFNKYGGYSLLLAWTPIFGDAITLLAGALKYNLKKFIILVSISKVGRYLTIYLIWREV